MVRVLFFLINWFVWFSQLIIDSCSILFFSAFCLQFFRIYTWFFALFVSLLDRKLKTLKKGEMWTIFHIPERKKWNIHVEMEFIKFQHIGEIPRLIRVHVHSHGLNIICFIDPSNMWWMCETKTKIDWILVHDRIDRNIFDLYPYAYIFICMFLSICHIHVEMSNYERVHNLLILVFCSILVSTFNQKLHSHCTCLHTVCAIKLTAISI